MALESLSSFSSTGTVSGTNTVNNTQKINTVVIGTGDITIDATKIPFSTSDSTNVNAKITSVDNSAVHKGGVETITGTKTFTTSTNFSNGIRIECDDGTSYDIRHGGTDGNELIIISNGQQSNGNNTILTVNANSVKIGSDENKPVELGYTVEDTSNSNEVATTKWVNTYVAVPAGTVITYAGTSTPDGYLFCDGSAVSRTTYSKLFEAIGTTYGNGDGSTTFNLPKINDNRFIEYVSTDEFNSKIDSTTGVISDNGLKDAGLPNITGYFGRDDTPASIAKGAFTAGAGSIDGSGGDTTAEGGDGAHLWFRFDASLCSDVYKNDVTTVQPKSITLKAYIKY